MPTKQLRTHGADDQLGPECGGEMTLNRRTPDPEHAAFERQTFECGTCLNTIERSVDRQASSSQMKEPWRRSPNARKTDGHASIAGLHFRRARIVQRHSVNLTRQNSDPSAYAETIAARKVLSREVIKNCGSTLIVSDRY